MPACTAIIVASGSSRRMGFDKLAADLSGRPVLRFALDAFLACEDISRILVISPKERFDSLLGQDQFTKPVARIDGGQRRQDSVLAGLDALSSDEEWVAVHDGARPLIQPEAISRTLTAARETGAATLARPISETIKRDDGTGFTRSGISRENLWHTETPQIFRTTLLRRAYREVMNRGLCVTDEVSALETIDAPTKLVISEMPNLKITRPNDLALARALLA